MVVSLEAIFLTAFVLVSQNRQSLIAEYREDLDLQINLLTEHEVTRMLRLVNKIAEHLGIRDEMDEEIDQLVTPVAPDVLLKEIERRQSRIRARGKQIEDGTRTSTG
jgi:uncharacterized membrane protein